MTDEEMEEILEEDPVIYWLIWAFIALVFVYGAVALYLWMPKW